MIRRTFLGLAALATIVTPTPAHADLIPSGYKSVKLSIEVEVEGKVPDGRTLLLLNTWKGATKLPVGETVDIQWHPLHGKMQLVSVTATQLEAIEAIADKDRGEERMPKMQAQATPCAEPFDGVRTVKDTEHYDEIRWHYAVALDGEACDGKLTRTSYLAEGEEVKAVPSAAPATSASQKPPKRRPSESTAADPPKDAPNKPASTCTLSALGPGPEGAWPGIGGTMLLLAGLTLTIRARGRAR